MEPGLTVGDAQTAEAVDAMPMEVGRGGVVLGVGRLGGYDGVVFGVGRLGVGFGLSCDEVR